MSNEKEVKDILAIDPGTENVNRFDGLLHKVQQGDVNASKSVYKAGEDFTPGGMEELLGKGQNCGSLMPMRWTDPDGTAEHLGRKISYIPDYETIEDGVVVSAAFAEETEREEKNYDALMEIVKCPSELEMFTRIKQVIIEKDVRIFDKMSRRRKKIYVSRLAFYEVQTGKYTTRKHKGHPGFKLRPARLRYTEVHGAPMEQLLNDWINLM